MRFPGVRILDTSAAIQDPVVESSGECSVFWLQHFLDKKPGKGFDVTVDTGTIRDRHIDVAPFHAHHSPWITGGAHGAVTGLLKHHDREYARRKGDTDRHD